MGVSCAGIDRRGGWDPSTVPDRSVTEGVCMNCRSSLQGTALLTILLVPIFAFTQTVSTPPRPLDPSSYGKLPLSFEANQGQGDPTVQFLSHGQGYTLLLREGEAVLALQG